MYRNVETRKKNFPAKVVLIKHKQVGYILVDTGYSRRVYENGWRSKIYNKLNETTVGEKDLIINQLATDGITQELIGKIILTHLHPDHIGSVLDFPEATLIMSKGSYNLMRHAKTKNLVFNNQLPENTSQEMQVVGLDQRSPLKGFLGIDLLDDGSIWLLSLEGHAKGQLGVYIPDKYLFFVADALWGMNYIDKEMKWIPRCIQHNYQAYRETIEKLNNLQGIHLITSHGEEVYHEQ